MTPEQLKDLLEQVRAGDVGIDQAVHKFKGMPFENMGFANVDHHRSVRHGMPEAIFGQGKSRGK